MCNLIDEIEQLRIILADIADYGGNTYSEQPASQCLEFYRQGVGKVSRTAKKLHLEVQDFESHETGAYCRLNG